MRARKAGICARCGEAFEINHHILIVPKIGPVHEHACATEGERAYLRGFRPGTWKKTR